MMKLIENLFLYIIVLKELTSKFLYKTNATVGQSQKEANIYFMNSLKMVMPFEQLPLYQRLNEAVEKVVMNY